MRFLKHVFFPSYIHAMCFDSLIEDTTVDLASDDQRSLMVEVCLELHLFIYSFQ